MAWTTWLQRRRRLLARRRRRRRINRYTGYAGSHVPIIDAAAIEPREFFARFVRRRRPCVLRGTLPELRGRPDDWWAPPSARALEVDVEVRDGPSDSFGRGRKARTTFGALLDGGSPNLYLSTQDVADGHLVAPPLTALAAQRRLPLRPALLAPLVPQSLNLWVGHSAAFASSGLHHDYHDNLYVLLRGTKRFRLFSPAQAHRMRTSGALARVHPNGRVNYLGDPPTTPDGRTREDLAQGALRAARRAQRRAQRRLLEAEDAADPTGGDGGGGLPAEAAQAAQAPEAPEAVEAAEAALDEAMDGVVAATRELRFQRKRAAAASETAERASAKLPKNFSRLGALQLDDAGQLPPRLRRARPAEYELRGGEMLYLPCGWFHEVSAVVSHAPFPSPFHTPCRSTVHSAPTVHTNTRTHAHGRAGELRRVARRPQLLVPPAGW
jgi:hypothetical protein